MENKQTAKGTELEGAGRTDAEHAEALPEIRPWREVGWIFRDGDALAIERQDGRDLRALGAARAAARTSSARHQAPAQAGWSAPSSSAGVSDVAGESAASPSNAASCAPG